MRLRQRPAHHSPAAAVHANGASNGAAGSAGPCCLICLDEPFSALDAFTRLDLQRHLLYLWEESRPTMLLVTHDIDEALLLASRIVVMQPGPGRIARTIDVDLARRAIGWSPLSRSPRGKCCACSTPRSSIAGGRPSRPPTSASDTVER